MINFRGFGHPRKLFNDEYFPDYGICKIINSIFNIKTRGSVSAAKKTAWRTSVFFTWTPVSTFSAYCSLKTIGAISTKFKYVLPPIYTTSQTKFERNSPRSLLVIHTWNHSDFIRLFLLRILRTKCTCR